MNSGTAPLAVTGIRVIDLLAPFPYGGTLAVAGDQGSGVNVVAMEVMHNLCRRYQATAICRVTPDEPFNEVNVSAWIEKLGVGSLITSVEHGETAAIEVANKGGLVATIIPFASTTDGADAWVTIRRAVLETGRLPAIALHESDSRHLTEDQRALADSVTEGVDRGDEDLIKYLGQPFFLAEPWTATKGEVTEPEEMLVQLRGMLGP